MILNIFKKYWETSKKKKIVKTLIESLRISDKQKILYLDSIEILDEIWLDKLYKSLMLFVEEFEMRELDDIKRQNFSQISWMRKKEAEEKQKDVNTFNFLLNNL
jgi:hypothetical protein